MLWQEKLRRKFKVGFKTRLYWMLFVRRKFTYNTIYVNLNNGISISAVRSRFSCIFD